MARGKTIYGGSTQYQKQSLRQNLDLQNSTCEEFNNGHFMDVEGKLFYVVRTAEHETAIDHGRARITFRSPIIYELTKKYLESHRPEPKDTDAAMYLFLTSSGTRISSARFYQHYNDVITKCNFQFLLGKSLDENYKSATNATVAKININKDNALFTSPKAAANERRGAP